MEFNFSTIDYESLSKCMEPFSEVSLNTKFYLFIFYQMKTLLINMHCFQEFGIPVLIVDTIPPPSPSPPIIPDNQWDMSISFPSPFNSPYPSPYPSPSTSPCPSPFSSPCPSPDASPSQDDFLDDIINMNDNSLTVNNTNNSRLSPNSQMKRKDCTVEFRKQFIALLHKDRKARLDWKEFHRQSECAKKRNCIKLMQLFCEKYGSKFADLSANKNFRALGTRSKCTCNSSHPSLLPSTSSSLFPIPPPQSFATPSQYLNIDQPQLPQSCNPYNQSNPTQMYYAYSLSPTPSPVPSPSHSPVHSPSASPYPSPSIAPAPAPTQVPNYSVPSIFPPAGFPFM